MTTTTTEKGTTSEASVERIALDATRICPNDGDAGLSRRVLIVPWGAVRSEAGDFIVDAEGAAAAIEAFSSHGADLPVDYEHQTLGGIYASPDGRAPAAGWITGLHAVPTTAVVSSAAPPTADTPPNVARPGLWADVSWTDEAKRQLAARQYRYLSPVALVRKSDRRLVGLHSAALTNKPAIVGMSPVVNREGTFDAPGIDVAPLRTVLRLNDEASEEAIVTAAVARIRDLEGRERQREATRRVEQAFVAGKLAAPQRDWAVALALKDPVEFDRWLECAPVIVPLGRTAAPDADVPGNTAARAVEAAARSEWRAHRAFLENLCTEDAYAAAALRDAT